VSICVGSIAGNILGAALSISVDRKEKNVTYINNVVIYRGMRVRWGRGCEISSCVRYGYDFSQL